MATFPISAPSKSSQNRDKIIITLESLFLDHFGHKPEDWVGLPASGSPRRYFRMWGQGQSVIGTWNENLPENETFFYLADHFRKAGVPVPKLLKVSADRRAYLQEDLGEKALLDHLLTRSQNGNPHPQSIQYYKQALENLAQTQIVAGKDLDFSRCWSGPEFDAQAMHWDLNYFKYYFLRPLDLDTDPYGLDDDFERLCAYLSEVPSSFFMYRDFQARNILIHEEKTFFIDFQGGRKGPLAYDLASLLYQARAGLSSRLREELLDHYLNVAGKFMAIDKGAFLKSYPAFVLLRLLQVLGAYGYRGWFERKPHFLASMQPAMKNLEDHLVRMKKAMPELPILLPILEQSLKAWENRQRTPIPSGEKPLRIRVQSFSYRQGLPEDPQGNGGGFIFDCRGIDNPGRQEAYKTLTGRDPEVIRYLQTKTDVNDFVNQARNVVDNSIRSYLQRGFTDLMISFGCTGGQHRSVYCADRLAGLLEQIPGVEVEVQHLEQERKGWKNN